MSAPAWGEIPLSCPQGKGVSLPGEQTERPPLTHLPATLGGGGRCCNFLGNGTSPRSLRVGEEWRGYIKEVGEKGSGTVRCAHPG